MIETYHPTSAARVVRAVNARTTHTHIRIVSGVLDHLSSLGEVRLPTGDADEFWTEFWTTLEAASGRPLEPCPECETNPQDPQRMSGMCDDCVRETESEVMLPPEAYEIDPARNDTPEVIIAELLAIAGGEPTGERESVDLWKRAEAYLNRLPAPQLAKLHAANAQDHIDGIRKHELVALLNEIPGDPMVTVYPETRHTNDYFHIDQVQAPSFDGYVTVVINLGRAFDTREI
jgi:hypothetical protein